MKLENLIAKQRLGFVSQDAFLCPNYKVKADSIDESDALYILNNSLKLISYDSIYYPLLLRHIDCPPVVLTVKGELQVLNNQCIAIVGARKVSRRGKEIAFNLARDLASQNFTIVSGLAYGVDTSAHFGALSVNGKTIAVIGCGIDVDYPARNHQLKEKIASNGAIITEFPLRTPAYPNHFPRRNRIISGLSIATIIVEASLNSGSLITAYLALNQGREVFVAQNSNEVYLAGNRKLIEEGAKEINCAKDVIACIFNKNHNNSGHNSNYDKKAQNITQFYDVGSLAGASILDIARFYKDRGG